MPKITRLETEQGSYYDLYEKNGRWWFRADNVANPHSQALDATQWWEIDPPITYPGGLVALRSPLPKGDPSRPSGGGKLTSRIVSYTQLEVDDAGVPQT